LYILLTLINSICKESKPEMHIQVIPTMNSRHEFIPLIDSLLSV
jgi:hypothetical protein